MKFLSTLLTGIGSAVLAVAILHFAHWYGLSQVQLVSQPAWERVTKNHTLRCAFIMRENYFSTIDPEHGIATGIAHDLAEQMGHILNLKIQWVQETLLAQATAHLADGSEDAICTPIWPDGTRAAAITYTAPLDYMPFHAYVRADDARFDGALSKINDGDITISAIKNDESKTIADEDYPQAAQYSVIDTVDLPHLLLAVTTKHADVAFADSFSGEDFIKNNPGTIKQVANVPPLRMFGESFAVAKNETKLRDMMNIALAQMQADGFTRATLDKYVGDRKGQFFYVAKPWE